MSRDGSRGGSQKRRRAQHPAVRPGRVLRERYEYPWAARKTSRGGGVGDARRATPGQLRDFTRESILLPYPCSSRFLETGRLITRPTSDVIPVVVQMECTTDPGLFDPEVCTTKRLAPVLQVSREHLSSRVPTGRAFFSTGSHSRRPRRLMIIAALNAGHDDDLRSPPRASWAVRHLQSSARPIRALVPPNSNFRGRARPSESVHASIFAALLIHHLLELLAIATCQARSATQRLRVVVIDEVALLVQVCRAGD